MTQKLRWGLLSTANINKALIDPLRRAERSELVAVASRDLAKAQAYAAEWGIPTAHGSYEALLADPGIDVIYNSLPNSMHAEWTVAAAKAGKHVLCEKPIVINLADLEWVERNAKNNKVVIFEAFMYLHHPQTRKVLELVQSGRLGALQQVNSWFHFYLSPERQENIRLRADVSGGSLWDVGVYPNSLAVSLNGGQAPTSVFADQIVGESGVDVAMRVQMNFGAGSVAQISSSFRTPFREGAFIVGDQAMLTVPEPWKPGLKGDTAITLTGNDGSTETLTFPAKDPYLCEVEAMEACVLDGADPVLPLSQSREFLRSVLAIYESARSGKVVSLD